MLCSRCLLLFVLSSFLARYEHESAPDVASVHTGEWWGTYTPGTFTTVLPMAETSWFKQDLFGLATAYTLNKLHFDTTPGGHLDFTDAQLFGWVDAYFS